MKPQEHKDDPDGRRYDFDAIELRWQRRWDEEQTWRVVPETDIVNPYYVLEMLPYASGEPHVGHLKNYAVGDAVAHFRRMQGYTVLHPMGYDAFGLPAENHAIRSGISPRDSTRESIEAFRGAFKRWGISIDWSREIATNQPEYYRWTQQIFIDLFEAGLAYQADGQVNWCPKDATVLANEQVIDGRCERCDSIVATRQLKQWYFALTAHAERLLKNLDLLDWPANVKTMQRNWIGRSEGTSVRFSVTGSDLEIETFTTRPETLYGVTFIAVAPDSTVAAALVGQAPSRTELDAFVEGRALRVLATSGDVPDEAGQHTGLTAIHPLTGSELPIYLADYVLAEYGTGAVMGVPGHDERDRHFAGRFGLPSVTVIDEDNFDPYGAQPTMINSGPADGLTVNAARAAIMASLKDAGRGGPEVAFRVRDWLISRQRYWGTPIPVLHCECCGVVPVPSDELPVLLPDIQEYAPQGRSPLAALDEWIKAECPRCGHPARRESDTMDTFVDSSWYFLRYTDPHNQSQLVDPALAATWLPVDEYIGGVEHAILHLMYARFLTQALTDIGHIELSEPFARLLTQGMITRDGAKMSKSKGNTVSPADIVKRYGADTARAYVVFMGPVEASADWDDRGLEGVHRFLCRFWRLGQIAQQPKGAFAFDASNDRVLTLQAQTIERVTRDFENYRFNTAIAALMKFANLLTKSADTTTSEVFKQAIVTLAQLLFPFSPHVACEVHELLGGEHLWTIPWPVADPAQLKSTTVELPIQINGRTKAVIVVNESATEDEILRAAQSDSRVKQLLDGSTIERTIVRSSIVNFVVSG